MTTYHCQNVIFTAEQSGEGDQFTITAREYVTTPDKTVARVPRTVKRTRRTWPLAKLNNGDAIMRRRTTPFNDAREAVHWLAEELGRA